MSQKWLTHATPTLFNAGRTGDSPSSDGNILYNLASIATHKYVRTRSAGRSKPFPMENFDFQQLAHVTRVVTKNLNRVIDGNAYPDDKARRSNTRDRPIGICVQGLADAFILMRMPFDSPEAQQLNKAIFETVYFAALDSSCMIAQIEQATYETYEGSPVSKGQLQFDMWGVVPQSGLHDWDALRSRIAQYGVRNSLLVAPMPTASTSQILGINEACEPYTSNICVRRCTAHRFECVSRYLLRDLIALKIWTPELKNKLIAHNGSVQQISEIPAHIQQLYKTVWEISQRTIIDMAADRGAYINQSQSLIIRHVSYNGRRNYTMQLRASQKGLQFDVDHLRFEAAADRMPFIIDPCCCHETVGSMIDAERFHVALRQADARLVASAAAALKLQQTSVAPLPATSKSTILQSSATFDDLAAVETRRLKREQDEADMMRSLDNLGA